MTFTLKKLKPLHIFELMDILEETLIFSGHECDLNFIDTSQIDHMVGIFNFYSGFDGDISGWDVSNVKDMSDMFRDSKFTGNIDDWNVDPNCNVTNMFKDSELEKLGKLPEWYKNMI